MTLARMFKHYNQDSLSQAKKFQFLLSFWKIEVTNRKNLIMFRNYDEDILILDYNEFHLG